MAPARTNSPTADDDDDPVTAEYSVYLTPSQQEQILLLQYPNRARARPYNARQGAAPDNIRIKPTTGYLELDVNLNTAHNFNKFQGLKWGDAMTTGREVQNDMGTYGVAAGFSGAKARSAGRTQIKDKVDRENHISNNLAVFKEAEDGGLVMHKQTLGGAVNRHDGVEEQGKPVYFVGAFRGEELHLTKVDATVQMRPQFHHLDAEEQRTRLAASRASALENGDASAARQADPRSLLMKNKSADESQKDRLEDRTRRILQAAEAEPWVQLEYVDEDQEEAYSLFHERMFVRDTEAAVKLQSGMDNDQYLDAISAPRRESPTRRRKRAPRRRGEVDVEMEDDEEGGDGVSGAGGGVDGAEGVASGAG